MPEVTGTSPRFSSFFSTLPPLPSCPPPGGTGRYPVRIPEVYSSYRPQITIYPPTIANPDHTLEALFPIPPNIAPRSFLDLETGMLTVLFRKLEGPQCKGGPGRKQEMATYEIALSKQWLEGERNWEAAVVTIEGGKEECQELEEADIEEKGYRVVFFGKDDGSFAHGRRAQTLPWAGPAREKCNYQVEDMEVIDEEEEEEVVEDETSSEELQRTIFCRMSSNRFVID